MLAWLGDSVEAFSWWIAIGVFLCCALWESIRPERPGNASLVARWGNHFALYGVSLCLVAVIDPFTRTAAWLGERGHEPLTLLGACAGDGAVLVAGLLAIDLCVYIVHRLQHSVFVLWRFHIIHHADTAVDATTAMRHHPLGYLMNAVIGSLPFGPLGLPPWVLACYGLLAVNVGLLQHANVRLPRRLETMLDLVIVGPALHRTHHSTDAAHFNSNFGIVFTIWDRLFGTYLRLADEAQDRISFGVEEVTASGHNSGHRLWVLPFLLRRPQPAPRLT